MRESNDPTDSTRQEFLAATVAAKARAESVLRELQAASAECESQLQKQSRTDPIRLVTGRSSLDAAIANTKRMIETFERAIQDARRVAEATARPGTAAAAAEASGFVGGALGDAVLRIMPPMARAGIA